MHDALYCRAPPKEQQVQQLEILKELTRKSAPPGEVSKNPWSSRLGRQPTETPLATKPWREVQSGEAADMMAATMAADEGDEDLVATMARTAALARGATPFEAAVAAGDAIDTLRAAQTAPEPEMRGRAPARRNSNALQPIPEQHAAQHAAWGGLLPAASRAQPPAAISAQPPAASSAQPPAAESRFQPPAATSAEPPAAGATGGGGQEPDLVRRVAQATPIPSLIGGLQLYIDLSGAVVNADGVRVDAHGRPTKPRGNPGRAAQQRFWGGRRWR